MGQGNSAVASTIYKNKTYNGIQIYDRRSKERDPDSEKFLSSSAAKILRDNRHAKRLAEGIERQAVVIANNHTTTPHCLMDVRDDMSERDMCDRAVSVPNVPENNVSERESPHPPEINTGEPEVESHSEETERNSPNSRLCSFSSDGDEDREETEGDDDTFESRIDLEKINSIKSKHSYTKKRDRKESFEQRLKRTFTIKDEHTSEVTKRILAIVIKYSLFVFNFLSWVMATGTIVSGIWMMTDKTVIVTTSDTDFFLDPPVVMCIGGGITFIVAFLGCVGALRENLILLKVFFYVLTFILLGEIVIGCGVFVIYIVPEARENFLRSQPEQILRSAVQKYMDDPDITTWLDKIQSDSTIQR